MKKRPRKDQRPGKPNRGSPSLDRRRPSGNPPRSKSNAAPDRIQTLYEDDAIVVLNKPAGLAAVPVKGSDAPSAWSLLSAHLRRTRERAYVFHRIDRYTSGAMLFAKTERDADALVAQFLAHTPVRQYLAVVRGHLAEAEGTLVHYFRREGMFQSLSTARDPYAALAELDYVVERRLRAASLIRVTLITGLQNQIRVQFSAIGHPVIGDRKYHPAEADERRIARVALHAAHLGFEHPRTRELVSVDCELPSDIKSLIQALAPTPRR
jgi:23S rRNA pseudouridine1911/1915/1917 synthase